MTGKSLADLDLKDEPIAPLMADDLPEFGGWAPPPQPGPFRFQIPPAPSFTVEKDENNSLKALKFDKDHPLVITWSPTGAHVGEMFQTTLRMERRQRGAVLASDLDYLVKALIARGAALPTTKNGFAQVVLDHAGDQFAADISYSWNCNPLRDRYVPSPDGTGTVKEEGVKGCGAKYYQAEKTKKPESQIAKVNGEYPYEIQCRCGAVVRAFANLDNIRKI